MTPRDQSRIPATTVGRVLAAVKAHPIAAAFAILTLGVAVLAAGRESQHTPRAQTEVASTYTARPENEAPTVPATHGWVLAHGPQPRSAATAGRERRRPVDGARGQRTGRALWPPAALNAARRFLSTYVLFTYAQIGARAIQAAAAALRARIAANPPEVPAAIRRLHPRVTVVTIIPARIADAGAGWAATATVSDRREIYQVTVKLGQPDGRWLVTAILAPSS